MKEKITFKPHIPTPQGNLMMAENKSISLLPYVPRRTSPLKLVLACTSLVKIGRELSQVSSILSQQD
jgi:hypothetical protein